MTAPLVFALPGNEIIAKQLAQGLRATLGALTTHTFPDGETGMRFEQDVSGLDVVLVCTLAQPNDKFLLLAFAASAARAQGARRIGLVVPYLCYMRQDCQFHPGEAVTSRTFASLISSLFDWMITVDPHLHRHKSLEEIYSIPTAALHAGPAIAAWIGHNVPSPFLIGPDEESRQWVAAVATACKAPFSIMSKTRYGDRRVRIVSPPVVPAGKTPVLVDDVISSGSTMAEALSKISYISSPVVVAIHGAFDEKTGLRLSKHAKIVTSDSIPNPAACITLASLLVQGIASMLHRSA